MTSWDTTQADVDRFLEGVHLVMSSANITIDRGLHQHLLFGLGSCGGSYIA